MYSFSEYLDRNNYDYYARQILTQNEQVITHALTFENITWEADLLNSVEDLIPESFNLHLDLILDGGSKAISHYYHELAKGKNVILEKAKATLDSASVTQIDEAFTSFMHEVKTKISQLNEQFTSTVDPGMAAAGIDPDSITKAMAGFKTDGDTDKSKSGIFETIKELLSALTEGGSFFGILQLILDVVGLIGGPGWGTAADSINAIIYFLRGKTLLGILSIVSAILGAAAGPLKMLKFGKSAAKTEEIIITLTKSGKSREAAEMLVKLPAKEQGIVMKALRFIAGNITEVMAKAGSAVSKFFTEFLTKVTSWIPGIGGPLKTVFEKIGATLEKWTASLTTFSKEFKEAESTAIKISMKEAGTHIATMLQKGGKMELDEAANLVRVLDKEGKPIGSFSKEFLKKSKVLNDKMPGLYKDPKALVNYYNSVSKTTPKFTEAIGNFFSTAFKAKFNTAKLAIFLGKEFIKYSTGNPKQGLTLTEPEYQYYGNSTLNSIIKDEMKKKEDATGAKYAAEVTLDSSDESTMKLVTGYQNEYAKLVGEPSIINVAYNKFRNDDTENEFKEFWDSVAAGKVKKEEDGAVVRTNADSEAEPAPSERPYNESFSGNKILSYSEYRKFSR